jgi:hypothetical protein
MMDAVADATRQYSDFGVRLSDTDFGLEDENYGGSFGVFQSDMDFADVVRMNEFSRDIGFDWYGGFDVGDFGTSGGSGFREFGNNDMIVQT